MGSGSTRWFPLLVVFAALFVAASATGLPDPVAAHFGVGGGANGFMPRQVYVVFMLLIVVGLPVLSVFATSASLARPGARINLPHRDYWLSPARRGASIAAIRAGVRQFAALLIVFLCYAHGLVVRANRLQPARLDEAWFVAGLGVFLIAVLWWVRRFLRGFQLPAPNPTPPRRQR